VTDGPVDSAIAEQLEEAERRGFTRGLNIGLVILGNLAALTAAWRSFADIPRYVEVYKQVKVPMPGLTLLVLEIHIPASILLLLFGAACIWITRKRGIERRATIMNAALFGVALFWLTIVTAAIHLPYLSLLEGIGQRRH
jgi:hypothetical protein